MNQAEKLKKVIEYAVERGWHDFTEQPEKIKSIEFTGDRVFIACSFGKESDTMGVIVADNRKYRDILFSHDFAKAVFGFDTESGTAKINPETELDQWGKLTKWARHLQQAVISEDPIQYYFDHINSKAKE